MRAPDRIGQLLHGDDVVIVSGTYPDRGRRHRRGEGGLESNGVEATTKNQRAKGDTCAANQDDRRPR
jgi:hypothetical protein